MKCNPTMPQSQTAHWMAALMCAFVLLGASHAEVLVLKSGELVKGQVVSTSADGITLALAEDDKGVVTYPLGAISARSFLQLRGKSLGDHEYAALFELSDFAGLHGLYREAGDLLSRVESRTENLAPELIEELANRRHGLREAHGSSLLADAQKAIDAGDPTRALELCRAIIADFAGTEAAKSASELSARALTARQEAAEASKQDAEAELAAEGDAARERALMRAQALLEQAQKHADDSVAEAARTTELIDSGNRTRMRKSLAVARQNGERALAFARAMPEALSSLESEAAESPAALIKEKSEKIERDTGDSLVRLYTRVIRSYMEERNYKAADELLQAGLEISPNDSNLRDFDQELSEKWKKRSAAARSNTGARVTNRP